MAWWARQSGTPTHELQRLGGWRSSVMVERYAHPGTRPSRESCQPARLAARWLRSGYVRERSKHLTRPSKKGGHHQLPDLVGELALEQRGDAAGELDDLQAALHLARGVRQHLAVLVGDDRGELLGAALTSSRNAKSTLVRFDSDDCDHDSNAAAAACTAASTSAVDASSTSACCSPVAGFHTGLVRVDVPVAGLPPIQWLTVLTAVCLRSGASGRACGPRRPCAPVGWNRARRPR